MKLRELFTMKRNFRALTPPINISLTKTAIQLAMESHQGKQFIPWESVRRVVAFKRDVYAHDLLCLALELEPQGVVELDESMNGWQELLDSLPEYLPGALSADQWLPRVAFPAFKESPFDVYQRS